MDNYFRWYTTDENSDTKLCINKGESIPVLWILVNM